MEPIDIKHALEKAGFTQKKIADQCGVTPTQVKRVINGSVSGSVRRAIAKAINKDIKEIWPEYYLHDSFTARPDVNLLR